MSRPNKNTHHSVKNVNGTSKPPYASSKSKDGASWLDTWRAETKSTRKTCSALGCSRTDLVGAHVITTDRRSDRAWHLTPLCKKHNHTSNTDAMFLDSRVTLVGVRPDGGPGPRRRPVAAAGAGAGAGMGMGMGVGMGVGMGMGMPPGVGGGMRMGMGMPPGVMMMGPPLGAMGVPVGLPGVPGGRVVMGPAFPGMMGFPF